METLFIIIIGFLSLWSLIRTAKNSDSIDKLNVRADFLKEKISLNARRANEHLRVLIEFADKLGYSIQIEENFLGDKKLICNKKQPAPKVKKLKVKSRK